MSIYLPRKLTVEEEKKLDTLMYNWVKAVRKHLMSLAKKETKVEVPYEFTIDDLIKSNELRARREDPPGSMEDAVELYYDLMVSIQEATILDGNLVFKTKRASGLYSADNNAIYLPAIINNKISPLVSGITFSSTISHETEHFLDFVQKSAYHPTIEELIGDKNTNWWDIPTEANALFREIRYDVIDSLKSWEHWKGKGKLSDATDKILRDLSKPGGKTLFTKVLNNSLNGAKSNYSILNFGKTKNFQAFLILLSQGKYKFSDDFKERVKSLYDDVVKPFSIKYISKFSE